MASVQISANLKNTIKHWKYIAADIHEPRSETEYKKLSGILDQLLEIVGDNESHELIGLVDVVSHMIAMNKIASC